MPHLARRALLIIAIVQFTVPNLPAWGIGNTISARALNEGVAPELPLGLFFGIIWGIIFTGYLGLAIWANLKPFHVADRLAPPLALAGLGNVVWMISSQMLGYIWLDFLLLLPILICVWEAAYRLDVIGGFDGTPRRLLVCLVTGLFAGWIAVALSISVPDVMRWGLGLGVTDYVWFALWMTLIPAVGLAWLFANRVSQSLWFFVALSWGLLGIVSNNWVRTEMHALAIAAAIIGAYVIFRRLRFGAAGAVR